MAKIFRVDLGLLDSQASAMSRLLELDWDEATRTELEGVESMLCSLYEALEENEEIRVKRC